MFGKIRSWFSSLSRAGKLGVVIASLAVVGVAANGNNTPSPKVVTPLPTNVTQTKADTIEKKTITETQSVPFDKTTVDDGSLNKGQTTLRTAGVEGVKSLTYEITLTNGVQTDKKLVSEEVTTSPISEVTAIGTYVYVAPVPLNCPNGTYVNSVGNTVCSPYSAPSAPAGATAQCGDGSYSFSQSRSGTCSHHGGVATWL